MSSVELVDSFVSRIFLSIPDSAWQQRAISHSHAVSRFAMLLAMWRREDPEIAAVCGLLHDLYAYEHLDYKDHAYHGAERAESVLRELNLFSQAQRDCICSAIRHHDDLDRTDGPMDEILKDADLLDNALGRPADSFKAYEQERLERVLRELGAE